MERVSPQKRPTRITSREERHVETTMKKFERRLDDGFRLVDERREAGLDVTRLEVFWIDLLHQYEALCDGLQEAA